MNLHCCTVEVSVVWAMAPKVFASPITMGGLRCSRTAGCPIEVALNCIATATRRASLEATNILDCMMMDLLSEKAELEV
jgi:hypothetical protein